MKDTYVMPIAESVLYQGQEESMAVEDLSQSWQDVFQTLVDAGLFWEDFLPYVDNPEGLFIDASNDSYWQCPRIVCHSNTCKAYEVWMDPYYSDADHPYGLCEGYVAP